MKISGLFFRALAFGDSLFLCARIPPLITYRENALAQWAYHFIYNNVNNNYTWIFFIYLLLFTIYSRYLKRVISKRDGCEYLKQVPSIYGSLELIWWDHLATFCWVLFLFQLNWTGLLLVGYLLLKSLKINTTLKAGKWRIRFPMISLDFWIDLNLPAALWLWLWLSL
jgi:hypothetical protein